VALLVVLALSLNGLNVVNSYVGRGFMTSLANREVASFYRYGLYYLAVFFASTLVAVTLQFAQDCLALFWRQSLTTDLVDQYLDSRAYYHLHSVAEIDNPDQRLSEDVRSFATTLLSFFMILLNSSITIVSFAAILCSIDLRLFLAAVGYAVVGSLATVLLGHRLVSLSYQQLNKEADLRYALVRIREYAEPIALLHGEAEEKNQVRERLAQVVAVIRRGIGVNRNVGFFTSFFNYLAPILPIVLVAPSFLRHEMEFGQVTQSAMAFTQFLSGLAVFIAQFQSISAFAAVVTRLGSLKTSIDKAQSPIYGRIRLRHDDTRVAYENLTLTTPEENRVLIQDLSLQITRGRRLLVRGSDDAAKIALFRATAGLWNTGSGTIVRPHPTQIMFLPRKPYTILGTLRDQVLYGLHDRQIDDDLLRETLRSLMLERVVERVGGLDAERDWPATLSIGEQQRLALTRLLLANPPFAFLDQLVNALSPAQGEQLYQLLAASSITYLTIGDHGHIGPYHDGTLEIAAAGSWSTELQPCGTNVGKRAPIAPA
jgi:putative ATP-binding cassette transporter